MDGKITPDETNPSELTVYQVARSVHLERLTVAGRPRRLVYIEASYDFDDGMAKRIDARQAGLIGIFKEVLNSRYHTVELNEPAYLKSLPLITTCLIAGTIRTTLGRRKPRFVSYVIENAAITSMVSYRLGIPLAVARLLVRVVLGHIISRLDKIAFGSAAAYQNYLTTFQRQLRAKNSVVIPALEPYCHHCTIQKMPYSLVFLGEFSRRKGFDLVLDIWPDLKARYPQAKLCLAGQGSMVDDAQVFARSNSGVSLHIAPSRETIHELLARAQVLVLPSRSTPTWREQIGLPILEGLSHGCQIVTTANTGIADWLRHHGHAILNDVDDLAALQLAVAESFSRYDISSDILSALPEAGGRERADEWLWSDD